MANGTNEQCAQCELAYNGINGRYCKILRRYVEHAPAPLCDRYGQSDNK
jgi:hypothetical protein